MLCSEPLMATNASMTVVFTVFNCSYGVPDMHVGPSRAGLTIVPVVPYWRGPLSPGAPDQLPTTFTTFSVGLNVTTTNKKGRQLLGEEKCTPRENPGYAYEKRAHALRWDGPPNG